MSALSRRNGDNKAVLLNGTKPRFRNRAQELVATGANVVGTACPFCNTMFRDALAAGTGSAAPPQLLDIAQIAAASLPK